MNPCKWVILWPRPTMMPESMGTMGKTQGVKASSRPAPKKKEMISQKLPWRNSEAMRELSFSPPEGAAVWSPAWAAVADCMNASGDGAGPVAAGNATVNVLSMG
jgi:hypothetical protein